MIKSMKDAEAEE